MNNNVHNTRRSLIIAVAAIIGTIIIGAGIIFGGLALLRNNSQTPISTQPNANSGSLPPGTAEPSCTPGGPCTNANDNSSTGCSTDGPCTQNSNGQIIIDGKITAVSATSISIEPSTGGSVQTYAITSSTQKESSSDSGSAFSPNDVKVGDSIGIALNSSKTQAERIMLGFNVQVQRR